MISLIVACIGATFTITALAATITRRLSPRQYAALFVTGAALGAIGCILSHEPTWAVVDAAAFAYWLHQWWTGGGGDNTRRRLRHLRRAFHGTRRTAPSAA